MILTTDEYTKLTEAVLASKYFVGIIRAMHDKGNFVDPQTGELLTKGSPQLLAKFEESLAVLETRCAEGLRVLGQDGKAH